MKRIGFGHRFVAAIFDFIILVLLSYLFSWILGSTIMRPPLELKDGINVFQFSHVLLLLVYFSTEIFFAATPGKMALSLKIKTEGGKKASTNTLLIRYLIKYSAIIFLLLFVLTNVNFFMLLLSLCIFIIFLGCFMVFMKAKQALHDKFAKTAVYR